MVADAEVGEEFGLRGGDGDFALRPGDPAEVANVGVGGGDADGLFEVVRVEEVVVIDKAEEGRAGLGDAGAARDGQARDRFGDDAEGKAMAKGGGVEGRGGSVVDEDQFVAVDRQRLGAQGIEHPADKVRAGIARADDDGKVGGHGRPKYRQTRGTAMLRPRGGRADEIRR